MTPQSNIQSPVRRLKRLVDESGKVVIVCHMTPDGDALGSSLCLCGMLKAMGKSAQVITPDMPAENLMFLPGAQSVLVASCHADTARSLLSTADLLFCLDFNDLRRIDRMQPMVEASSARRVVIDHHLNPSIDADILFSSPERASTCELLYSIIMDCGWERWVDRDAATCCCAGIMTDTGNFAYNANSPEMYAIMARIMRKGVDKNDLYIRLFDTNTLRRIRIMGFAQCSRLEVIPESRAALITLSAADLADYGYRKGDTEGLVNIPLSIPGVICSVYLREDDTDFIKVSMRSRGDFSVKNLCEKYFGGGGHTNAAGGEFHGPLTQAVETVRRILSSLPAPADNSTC